MLTLLLSMSLAVPLPQGPHAMPGSATAAVAVRGDTELSPASAYASARRQVDEHVRSVWQERAERTIVQQRPFWLPEPLAEAAVRRWLAELPVEQAVQLVDREDREREHEFGSSYTTTLWVAEDARTTQRLEQRLRRVLSQLERGTAVRLGGVAASWTLLIVLLGWLDRLSRGYMTGRLRLVGLLGGVIVPVVAFLV
jgi:hypothetical protein